MGGQLLDDEHEPDEAKKKRKRKIRQGDQEDEKKHDANVTDALPPDWEKRISKNSGQTYYYNKKTKVTQWDPPIDLERLGAALLGDGSLGKLAQACDKRGLAKPDQDV